MGLGGDWSVLPLIFVEARSDGWEPGFLSEQLCKEPVLQQQLPNLTPLPWSLQPCPPQPQLWAVPQHWQQLPILPWLCLHGQTAGAELWAPHSPGSGCLSSKHSLGDKRNSFPCSLHLPARRSLDGFQLSNARNENW